MKYPSPPCHQRLLHGALALCLAGAAVADNIVEELAGRPEFSTLVTAVTEAGLADALADAEDITVFAPSNDAFAQIPADDLEALLADKTALTNLLLYHVAPEEIGYRHFESGPLDTLLNLNPDDPDSSPETVDVDVKSYFWGWYRTVRIDESRITRANIHADNGIIHRLDRVLDPGFAPKQTILEIAAGNPDFSILAGLVGEAGLADALGNERNRLTVFAPTNAAFEALGQDTLDAVAGDRTLLRNILRNHLAYGIKDSSELAEAGEIRTLFRQKLPITSDDTGALFVDGKPIVAANIEASNGIIHVVGEVLVPPTPQSLVDLAVARDDLTTFVTAVTEAGLVPTFDSTRRWPAYTIFAPNDDAFAALPPGTLDTLLADPTGALADVLQLHVVRGRLQASRLHDGQVLRSLSGERLKVSITTNDAGETEVRINNALVAETDLFAENGVIHIMGDVIAADTFTIADLVESKSYLSTLQAALEAADLTGALANPDAQLTVFAPVDSAFKRLPDGTLDSLLAEDPPETLSQILLYHVVGESLSADELVDAGTAPTLLGPEVEITSRTYRFWRWWFPYSIVKINGNRVISSDIQTDNGTVHLISGVLLPPAEGDPVPADGGDNHDDEDDDDDD